MCLCRFVEVHANSTTLLGRTLAVSWFSHLDLDNILTNIPTNMAGPRANLAVTKDGETYNKLRRPGNYFDESVYASKTNERKRERERAVTDKAIPESVFGNKRVKTHHAASTANVLPQPGGGHQYRSNAPIAECGMRFTLPVDNEEEQYSDDSLGEALAYLRSVR